MTAERPIKVATFRLNTGRAFKSMGYLLRIKDIQIYAFVVLKINFSTHSDHAMNQNDSK